MAKDLHESYRPQLRGVHNITPLYHIGPSQSGKSTIMKQFEMMKFGEE